MCKIITGLVPNIESYLNLVFYAFLGYLNVYILNRNKLSIFLVSYADIYCVGIRTCSRKEVRLNGYQVDKPFEPSPKEASRSESPSENGGQNAR